MNSLLIAGRAVWFYVGKLFWPYKLAFIYDRWDINAAVLWQYLYPLAALTLLLILWLLRRRLGRGPLVAALFFGGTLFPALGFINVYPMRYSFVADHFQYLASLGVITLVIASLASLVRGWRWRWAPPALGAALLLIFGVCTWRQARLYDNAENLWRDTLTKSPNASVAANNLWIALGRQGRFQEAIPFLETAVRVHPTDEQCRNNLANAYADAGRLADALRVYHAALAQWPNSARLHYNLGTTYARAGRLDEAIAHLTQAVRLDRQGRIPAARDNLALALQQRATQPASQPATRLP